MSVPGPQAVRSWKRPQAVTCARVESPAHRSPTYCGISVSANYRINSTWSQSVTFFSEIVVVIVTGCEIGHVGRGPGATVRSHQVIAAWSPWRSLPSRGREQVAGTPPLSPIPLPLGKGVARGEGSVGRLLGDDQGLRFLPQPSGTATT